jgi:hypothetical protein
MAFGRRRLDRFSKWLSDSRRRGGLIAGGIRSSARVPNNHLALSLPLNLPRSPILSDILFEKRLEDGDATGALGHFGWGVGGNAEVVQEEKPSADGFV